jgi:Collagen triple helix repeat (20 copies)
MGFTGATGATGSTGFAGLPGLPGAVGATGYTGPAGLPGVAGSEGQAGPKGETGTAGIAGPAGSNGEKGVTGSAGQSGPKGETGTAGSAGPKGETGAAGLTGSIGPAGATGAAGPAGPEGASGSPAYAEFYALMPPGNAATVAAGSPVSFPQSGATAGGIVRLNPAEFVLPRVGTYSVDFSVSVTEAGQLVIALDSGGGMVELPYTVYGRATGASQIAGDALITTTAASSSVELRNPEGNTPALTITPLAGGAQPAVASIVIQQLG